jgi:hypothetical protein
VPALTEWDRFRYCPPKAEVTGSNPVGCANIFNNLLHIYTWLSLAIFARGERLGERFAKNPHWLWLDDYLCLLQVG